MDRFRHYHDGAIPLSIPSNDDNMDSTTTNKFTEVPMDIQIEKNIPISEKGKKTSTTLGYEDVMLAMGPGDSFLHRYDTNEVRYSTQYSIIASALLKARKVQPLVNIVTRRVEGGIRVWRVADTTPVNRMG